MLPEMEKEVLLRYKTWSTEHSNRLTSLHNQMLTLRKSGLDQISREISRSMGNTEFYKRESRPILFDRKWLEEFATGDIVKCLGTEFAIYKNRRSPRIPNGDLLLMSRILSIRGNRGEFNNPSQISAELDIPVDAWFFDGSANGELPLSILLEIGLQPCGVLSAWLGTQLRFPEVDFFFRNLDGEVRKTRMLDTRGKTVQTKATLTRTVFSGSTIIQHFEFNLACDGETFFKGKSSFGYFPEESMASQNGLDGGKSTLSWGADPANKNIAHHLAQEDFLSLPDIPKGQLRLIDEASINMEGGSDSKGYVMATRRNIKTDWFYKNHFFGDPVMPGSLGVEEILQAFKAAIHAITRSNTPVTLALDVDLKWKYRGQVLQNHKEMQVDVHFKNQQVMNGIKVFTGDANLWAEDIRIYEIQNLALQQEQGNI
jgi:3-hydroxymyristoyl/3-hydroxydecanoyl-(acyl carrier protein) dehydratase